ncbi:MAG: radical SAM protein, partial [Clostridiales bacterium]
LVLVMTLVPNINLDHLGSVLDFLLRRLPHIRGLHLQPISHFGRYPLEDAPQNLTLQDVFRQLVKQSGGRFHEEDFSPLASGHPLCSFQGNFLWENGEI